MFRLHKEELNAIHNEEQKYKKLVELNVEEQCNNIIKTAVLQQAYIRTGYPLVHGWVFDVKTGELIDLDLDFPKMLKEIQEIYNLGSAGN